MSVAFSLVPNTVIADQTLTLAEHRVLASLFSFRSSAQDFTVWPSRERIGERCGITSVAHVSRILGRLTKKGWIEDITRRRGSSVYRLSPGPTCAHRAAQVHVHTGQHTDQTRNTRQEDSPNPSLARGEDDHVEIDIHPAPVEALADPQGCADDAPPTAGTVPETPQARSERQERPEAVQRVDESPTPANTSEARTARLSRIEAGRRLVARLNEITGAQLDTRAHSATVKRAARRLRHHSEQDLVEVIEAKGREFRHPAALLKPSVVEAILSERRQRAAAEQRRRAQERAALDQVQPVQVNVEAARAGVQAMRAALGCRLAC